MARRSIFFSLLAAGTASADNFGPLRYDAQSDAIIVTMIYRGTNPNHTFDVRWGSCRTFSNRQSEVTGEVLDSQWRDAARQDFQTVARISVAALPCRPAKVTLRTAPNFYTTVQIPAASRGR